MARLTDHEAMQMALEIASHGAGFVSPNPLVGCIVLDRDSNLLAKGYHRKVGGPHAEVEAIHAVQDKSKLDGAHVFVTLEPCAHHGRTPPCAEMLAKLPLARVVYGLKDPNPLVAGQGLEILKKAGIAVEVWPEFQGELEDLAEVFLYNMRTSQAFIGVKIATSMDGHLGIKGQGGFRLSGQEGNDYVQHLRGSYDAILVGRKTFELDNPRLNCRDPRFAGKDLKVFVVDPDGKALPLLRESQLFRNHKPENIIWLVGKSLPPQPIQQWEIPSLANGKLDWKQFALRAWREKIASVLVEGGAEVVGSMLEQHAVQRWMQLIAPVMLGARGHSLSTGLFTELKLANVKTKMLGADLFLTGRLSLN